MKKRKSAVKNIFNLDYFKNNWNELAYKDPLWAILSDQQKISGGWSLDDFLKTGRSEVEKIIAITSIENIETKKALDFGCGIGRLTIPLGENFNSVYGVDISKEMIKKAKEINTNKNIKYVVNEESNLKKKLNLIQ